MRVYLGVRNCELFLCFLAIVTIMLTSLFCGTGGSLKISQVLTPGRAENDKINES